MAAAAEAAPGPDLKTAASYVPTRATKKKMARSFCPGKLPLKNDSDAAAAAAVGRRAKPLHAWLQRIMIAAVMRPQFDGKFALKIL